MIAAGPSGDSFTLGLSLASRFGLVTTYDAADRLRAALRRSPRRVPSG